MVEASLAVVGLLTVTFAIACHVHSFAKYALVPLLAWQATWKSTRAAGLGLRRIMTQLAGIQNLFRGFWARAGITRVCRCPDCCWRNAAFFCDAFVIYRPGTSPCFSWR